MTFSAILLLAIGLAMDAMAVAAARGLATPKVRPRHVILVASFFGGSQAFMPLLGWVIGSRLGPLVQTWDHWIAFLLLGAIGGKMLWEARGEKRAPDRTEGDPFGLGIMSILALATSIDALAAGITLPMMKAPLVTSVLTIGITTALFSALGLFAGRKFGSALGNRLDVVGGVVLIGLGAKILFEHLRAA